MRIAIALLMAVSIGCSSEDSTGTPEEDAQTDSVSTDVGEEVLLDSATTDSESESSVDSSTSDSSTGDSAPDGMTKGDSGPGPDVGPPPFSPGDVVISEILVRAGHLGSSVEIGEYVELYNRTTATITLHNCRFESAAGIGTESQGLADIDIPAKGFVVVRNGTDGITYDYSAAATFTSLAFEDTDPDFVRLVCIGAAAAIDEVGWNGRAPSAGTAASLVSFERSTASLSSGVATSTTTWCAGKTNHDISSGGGMATFKGSPGAANECP